jgi:hypothetical protein
MQTLVTYYLALNICLVLLLCYGVSGNAGEVSSILYSVSGIIECSKTRDTFVYWMMGLVIMQPISHKLFTTSSPVTLCCAILYHTIRDMVEL